MLLRGTLVHTPRLDGSEILDDYRIALKYYVLRNKSSTRCTDINLPLPAAASGTVSAQLIILISLQAKTSSSPPSSEEIEK